MAVVLLAALAVLAVLAWRTTVDPRIVYLRHEAGARWIRADRPFELRSWKDAALLRTSVFRVAFESSGSWSRAELAPELALRALTAVVVRLDGVVLHDDRDDVRRIDWRELRRIPFPVGLAAGRHELEITVTNPAGPALLLAHCDALSLRSGSAWTAKVGDAKWAPALDASVMPTPELAQAFPPVADAVGLLVPWIASIFVVVALASGAWQRRWLPARARNRPWSSDAFAALVAVAWIVLIVNNLPRLPPSMGMDAQGHLEYIDHLTKHGTIPLASDGWQMFQPPLYYALSVLFVKPILGLVSVPSLHRALRLLPMLCGLATALLCHRVSRAVFPQRADLGTIATCVGALMPMSLAISQCVGNEPLTATFTAWALGWPSRRGENPRSQRARAGR